MTTSDRDFVTLDQLREALRCKRSNCACARSNARNYHCPTHDDTTPSFTVSRGADGTALVHCKTGCDKGTVINELVRRKLWPVEGGGDQPQRHGRDRRRQKSAEWRFVDPATGELLAIHERWDYIDRDENGALGKEFLWRSPDGRAGLNGLSVHELPLYGAELLTEAPDDLVWVVEGEKAADACAERGLLAVSLPGGAAQKRFGAQLDLLRDRDVVLWPDNDEPGRSLMTRIATLLPDAKVVKPDKSLRGDDAYDYFLRNGTLEQLEEMLKDPEPVAHLLVDGVEVVIPKPEGTITFLYQQLLPAMHTLRAYLHVSHTLPERSATPFHSRLDLYSLSNKEAFARELKRMYSSGKDDAINWTELMNTACYMASEAYMNRAHAVSLDQISESETEDYVVDGFLPLGQLTTMFADGGSGKTYISLLLAICALAGVPFFGRWVERVDDVLFVDYESTDATIRKRFRRICEGLELNPSELLPHFHYYDTEGIALEHQSRQIRQELRRTDARLVIIDSAAAACGGEPEHAENALSVFNTTKSFGQHVTTVLIAHNTKEGQDDKPFGSVFWHNNSRMTHYVMGVQPPGGSFLHVGVWNRKANDDTLQEPFAFRIKFDGKTGPVAFEDVRWLPKRVTKKKNIRQAVIETLKQNEVAMTAADIHLVIEESGMEVTKGALQNALTKGQMDGLFHGEQAGRSKLWMLGEDRSPNGHVAEEVGVSKYAPQQGLPV